MKICDFFTTANGKTAKLYSLENQQGFKVNITDMGGAMVNIFTPDSNNRIQDVLLGFKDVTQYETNPPFFGALIGRVANRIAFGHFYLDGVEYKLQLNDGNNRPNALHGVDCYGRRLWQAEPIDNQTLKLSLNSPHGDGGFPGEVKITVIYHVTENNEIEINYSAVSDRPTIINLTQHAYFNLHGQEPSTCVEHEVISTAAYRTENDKNLIPTGKISEIANTPYDLSNWRSFESIIEEIPGAMDDNFIIASQAGKFQTDVFKVRSLRSGITMSVDSDQPGIQFYMGGGLNNTIIGKNGYCYPRYSGFCLEAQNWPDGINHLDFPSPRLNPGEVYRQHTVYRFALIS